MTGVLKDGKIVYQNPYYGYDYDIYGITEIDRRKIPPAISYDIYNPRNFELVEGDTYDFEVIFFDDGNVAEILDKPTINQ